jgi:hypothetical protein
LLDGLFGGSVRNVPDKGKEAVGQRPRPDAAAAGHAGAGARARRGFEAAGPYLLLVQMSAQFEDVERFAAQVIAA